MSGPPGRRTAPGKAESGSRSLAGDDTTVSHDRDIVSLKHSMAAIYVRDPDPLSIAMRRLRRGGTLKAEQSAAYEAWLAEQRQDAS